jgi:staphylococcal nuclease domain-containing protein 1
MVCSHSCIHPSLPAGKKAKAFFNLLQKEKTFRALVDYVFTGSRFKITIPSENATVNFALAQVRCPSLAKPPQANATLEEGEVPPAEDPLHVWGENAKRFSRLNVLQRMVCPFTSLSVASPLFPSSASFL